MINNNIENINEQIISLRKKEYNQYEIMGLLNVTRDKVRYVLKKAGMKNFKYKRVCRNCKKNYETVMQSSKFCEEACRTKYNKRTRGYNKIHNRKRIKRMLSNGGVDYGITTKALIKKYNGICYLCKNKVDEDDYHTNSNGHFVTGDYYPSVDHVIPISKGGTHTWENVRLAHRICNLMKSNHTNIKKEQLTLL